MSKQRNWFGSTAKRNKKSKLRRRQSWLIFESLERREMLNGDPVDLETSEITGCGNAAHLLTQIIGETAEESLDTSMPEENATDESSEDTSGGEMSEGTKGGESTSPAAVSEIEQRRIDAKNDRDDAIASITGGVVTTGTRPDEVEATERVSLTGDIESAVATCSSAVDGPREDLLTLISSSETTRDEAIADANALKSSSLATADADYAAEKAGAKADAEAAVASAKATRDASVTNATAAYNSAATAADSTYDATTAATDLAFEAIVTTADATFESDVSGAFATYESTVTTTRSSYDTIVAGSEAMRDIVVGVAELAHEVDLGSAASTHSTAIASAISTYDVDIAAAGANRESALSSAQAVYDTAVASALTVYLAGPADQNQTAPLDLQSDPIYVSAVDSAATAAQNSIDAALVTYDIAIATADSDYETAIANAQSAFDAAVALADTAYALSEALANSIYQSAVSGAQSAYDAAAANANSTFDSSMTKAKSDFDTAVASAKASRDSTVNGAQATFDSLKSSEESQRDSDNATEQDTFDATEATAAGTRDNTLADIESGFDSDASAADTTYQNAIDTAQGDYDLAIANAVATRDGALQSAKSNFESTISSAMSTRNSDLDTARSDRNSAKETATDDLNSAFVDAKEAQEVSRRDAETTHNNATIDANQILWDAKQTRDVAVYNAYMMMGMSCNDMACYEAAMNAASAIQQAAEDTYNGAKKTYAISAAEAAKAQAVSNAEANITLVTSEQEALVDLITAFAEADTAFSLASATADKGFVTSVAPAAASFAKDSARENATYAKTEATERSTMMQDKSTAKHAREMDLAPKEEAAYQDTGTAVLDDVTAEASAKHALATAMADNNDSAAKAIADADRTRKIDIANAEKAQANAKASALKARAVAEANATADLDDALIGAQVTLDLAISGAEMTQTQMLVMAWAAHKTALAGAATGFAADSLSADTAYLADIGAAAGALNSALSSIQATATTTMANAALTVVTTWDAAQGTRWSAFVLARTTAWVSLVSAQAAAEAAHATATLNAHLARETAIVTADGNRAVAEATANELLVGSITSAAASHAFAVASAQHNVLKTGEANAWEAYVTAANAASVTHMTTVSAAAETAANEDADAYGAWVNAEANAAKTASDTITDAEKAKTLAEADAEKAAKMRVGNAAKAQADAKGTALRAHREAVANAENDYHTAVWPEFESFVETAADAQKAQADAIADATADYRQALANAAVDYLTANGPTFVGLATDIANVEKTYQITLAEINKDAATQGGDDRIVELNAMEASEFSGYEPYEPDSFADMLMYYLNYGLQSIADFVANMYDQWIGEAARKIGTAFGFLNSLPQQHQMNQAAKTLATRRMVADDPSITVQDYVDLYKLPPEALTAIELIASSYIQFLGSGASFASPSVAAMNGMPAAMQMEARAALADIGLSPCFVAGTTVVTAADSDAAIIVADQYIGIALAGVAVAGYEVSRRRTKRKRRLEQEEVFENWPDDNDVDPFDEDATIFDPSTEGNERLSDEDWYAEPAWSMNSLYQDADTWNEEWTPMKNEEESSVFACCNANSTVDGGLTHSNPESLTPDLPRTFAQPRLTRQDRARRSKCRISPAKRTAAVATNRNAYGKIWLAVMLLAAGWIGFHSSFSGDHEALVPIASHVADVNSAIATKNIEDVRVGDRVHAENPTDDRDDPFVSNINHWTWRTIHFQAEKLDGGAAEVTLLRPLEWLRDNDVRVGRDIHLTLREVGIDGPARVLNIGDCPEIKPGVGQIVTGTFKHTAANVVDLHIDSLDEPIGVTANHPFWSHDRQDFVPAGELQPGERLKTLEGLAKVTGITERGPPEPVYNFEVHLHHVYHVTDVGVLVHNDCNATGGVYVLRDPETGKVLRTGRTNDLKRRKAEHKRDYANQGIEIEFDPIHQTDDYAQQRGLEELLHQEYSDAPLNRTNAVSAKNKRYGEYVTAAIQYLKDKSDFDREIP